MSKDLTKEFGKGYSVDNLERIRNFYLLYQHRISASVMRKSSPIKSATPMRKSEFPFSLSWTHYLQLMKISDVDERNFYEIEAAQNNWSVRELKRQFNAPVYERVALSQDKKRVKYLATKGQIIEKPTDALKSHYVLEFLNLKEDSRYSESDLETAIINRLEHFMLELGKGFLFEGRQRRFTFKAIAFLLILFFITGCLNALSYLT